MSTDTQEHPNSTPTWMVVTGWIITLLVAAALIMSGVMKLIMSGVIKVDLPPEFAEGFAKLGWQPSAALGLAIIEIGCAVLFLFPRSATIGAILVTGYLGGAVATHVRLGDDFAPPVIIGVLAWIALLLRDARVRSMLPWRTDPCGEPFGGFFAGFLKFLLAIVFIVLILVGISTALPVDYHVERTETINAPVSEVFPHINDFNKWKAWTPWLDADPNTKVTIEGSPGKGATYLWNSESNSVGEGKMTLTESVPNERVKLKLEFMRPMQGTPDGEFTFKADGAKTVVTWSISGERNLMTKAIGAGASMDKMIGPQFEKGLKRLKEVVETEHGK